MMEAIAASPKTSATREKIVETAAGTVHQREFHAASPDMAARAVRAPSRESSCCGCPVGSLSLEIVALDEELRADCGRAFLSLPRAESGESK